jgi:hypothetical protein
MLARIGWNRIDHRFSLPPSCYDISKRDDACNYGRRSAIFIFCGISSTRPDLHVAYKRYPVAEKAVSTCWSYTSCRYIISRVLFCSMCSLLTDSSLVYSMP